MVPALAALVYDLAVRYMAQRDPRIETADPYRSWIYYLVEVVFGVWLLLGARGARKLFWWARNAN